MSYTKERVAVMLFARSMELAAHVSPTVKLMAQDPMGAWERALSPAERQEWTAMVDEIEGRIDAGVPV